MPQHPEFEEEKHVFLGRFCDSICCLNQKKLVMHGDLRPLNVICGDKYQFCYVIDLGLSSQMKRIDEGIKRPDFVGTPHYASPASLKASLNPAAVHHVYPPEHDLWGVGWLSVRFLEPEWKKVMNWLYELTRMAWPQDKVQQQKYLKNINEHMMQMYDEKTKTLNYPGSNLMCRDILAALFTHDGDYQKLSTYIRNRIYAEINLYRQMKHL
jgi:serine/threonine protein kinase